MKDPHNATISDIAKIHGVSIATVSRVLSNSDYPVSEELRKAILQTAEELQYIPNLNSKVLKTGKSNELGIIVPTLSNPFYMQIILGAANECMKNDLHLSINCSNGSPKYEEEAIYELRQRRAYGLMLSTVQSDAALIQKALSNFKNVLLLDQVLAGSNYVCVKFDYVESGRLIIDYLLSQGHEKVAFLTPNLKRNSRVDIISGIQQEMSRRGCPEQNLRVITLPDTGLHQDETEEFELGKLLAEQYIKSGFQASVIVAVNDITAFGIMQVLLNNHYKIPNDISIVGFDNIKMAEMVNPPLTTVDQPSYELGRLAVRKLIHKGDNGENNEISLSPSIVERASVKKIIR